MISIKVDAVQFSGRGGGGGSSIIFSVLQKPLRFISGGGVVVDFFPGSPKAGAIQWGGV